MTSFTPPAGTVLFTPNYRGRTPKGVRRYDRGRLALYIAPDDYLSYEANRDEGATVTDRLSGRRFHVQATVCGLACQCAASARLAPKEAHRAR